LAAKVRTLALSRQSRLKQAMMPIGTRRTIDFLEMKESDTCENLLVNEDNAKLLALVEKQAEWLREAPTQRELDFYRTRALAAEAELQALKDMVPPASTSEALPQAVKVVARPPTSLPAPPQEASQGEMLPANSGPPIPVKRTLFRKHKA
jgi:hypothetical protein